MSAKRTLEKFNAPASVKIALLWASLMHLYIYNDYFSMYLPGTVDDMMAGRIGPLGEATPTILIAVAIVLAIPALMIFLSIALAPTISRWLNALLAIFYTVIQGLTFPGSAPFYQIVVGLEIAVTLLILFYALTWRKVDADMDDPA